MQKGSTQTTDILTGAQTASINSASAWTGNFSSVITYINVTAASGTSPSLTVTMQDSPDGVTWYNIPSGASTAITAAGTQRLLLTNVGPFVRAALAITGTTPSFTVDIQLAGNN